MRALIAALLMLGCGARSALTEPSPSDGGVPAGGRPPIGGEPGVGGFGGQPEVGGSGGAGGDDECTAPPAAEPTWAGPLTFLALRYGFDGGFSNGGVELGFEALATTSEFTDGMFLQAIRVGGPGFVELPGSSDLLTTTGVTIALWFRHAEGVDGMPLIDCRSETRGFHTYRSDNGLTTCWGAGTPRVGPGGCVSIELDDCDWHHLILRKLPNVDVAELYLDGNPKAEIGELGFALFGGDTRDILLGAANIGGFENTSTFEIDELRVHQTAIDEPTQCEGIVGGTWTQENVCVL